MVHEIQTMLNSQYHINKVENKKSSGLEDFFTCNYNKPITSCLVRLYDFYFALVAKDCKTHSFDAHSFAISYNLSIKIVQIHQQ